MADDLLVKLLDTWISGGKVPDEMSREFWGGSDDGDDLVVYFRWLDTNKEIIFGYTEKRYNQTFDKFNAYWLSRSDIPA